MGFFNIVDLFMTNERSFKVPSPPPALSISVGIKNYIIN
jgi:hypothetical protein